MIKKERRLKEKEVKRVLHKGKPFFSYGIVVNMLRKKTGDSRFAIVLGGKSVKNNVTRNFFRRKFYDIIQKEMEALYGYDFVFVVKKNNKVDKNDENSIISFEKDIHFLLKKIKDLVINTPKGKEL